MKRREISRSAKPTKRNETIVAVIGAVICLTLFGCTAPVGARSSTRASSTSTSSSTLHRSPVPAVDDSPAAKARRLVSRMNTAQQVGQLVMAPLSAGYDPSTLRDEITQRHVGAVLITGNWNGGVHSVADAIDTLQGYVPNSIRLLTATDQEGGSVQHLRGAGFDPMPSAVSQGLLSTSQLRASAATWGSELRQAGINVNLAPVADTVEGNRMSNAPIGALNRDFGLDAHGNGEHAAAFIDGMRDAGVQSAIKHYPGLGAVTGNTDFTTRGIVDDTTKLDGPQIGAFTTALQAHPAMVMVSLATYAQIDQSGPAAFSKTLIDGYLRTHTGYAGVVISDSLSATALSGTAPDQLGVRLVDAGADLACISAPAYVDPVLDGLESKASVDKSFATKVRQSAIRILTLKYQMGIIH